MILKLKERRLTPQIIIFDLDGTLVDSKADITFAFNLTLEEFGLPSVAENVIADFVGTGVRPLMRQVIPEGSQVQYADLAKRFEQLYAENLSRETRLFPGFEQVLHQWADRQKYILTNKLQYFTDKLLKEIGLSDVFMGVFGRDAFERSKPDPLPIIEICRIARVDTSQAVMIGDTPVDVTAGKAAGASTVGVSWGYSAAGVLEASGPDVIVHSPKDLLNTIP